jgi:Asp/Glu/hydantoin racemase
MYTAPAESPPSINNGKDIEDSARIVFQSLSSLADPQGYDAVLVACYSVHSLVESIPRLPKWSSTSVIGILEASILTCLALVKPNQTPTSAVGRWGVVTTGRFWESHLSDGVIRFIGQAVGQQNTKFAGVYSTGLDAGDFHLVKPEEVRERLAKATVSLLRAGDVQCVVMGCAGMAGLENIIRTTAIEEYGETAGKEVIVIDGVKAGILQLEQMIRSRRTFGQ